VFSARAGAAGRPAVQPPGWRGAEEDRVETGPRGATLAAFSLGTVNDVSTNELGAFLRARRDALTPQQVGLPAGPRRRAPGLRRSEVATLAGVSVEYLTRLEQGRDRRPSSQVLAALADALRLPAEERYLLLRMTKDADGGICPAAAPPAASVRPTVQALLDRLEPAPAVLLNRLSDVLAATVGYERLALPTGLLDGEPPNLVRYLFTDPRARSVFLDWDEVADAQVATVRADSMSGDPHVAELAADLSVVAGAPFSERFEAPPRAASRAGTQRLRHPEVGELRLAYETLELPDADNQRLVVFLAADEATSAALDRLTGRHPGALRAVSG
jgi:transcriptional regulator with XRE-family HTH domain